MKLKYPKTQYPQLDYLTTEQAIKFAKDHFEKNLAQALSLVRVSAPLFVKTSSGLNDELSGHERSVRFDVPYVNTEVEIVHSLAKWKRQSLATYHFNNDLGLYTDMNAIRRDEKLSNIHSIYVDQWDWEKPIAYENRNLDTLKFYVRKIVQALKTTQQEILAQYSDLSGFVEEDVKFITTQELLDLYPTLTAKEREYAFTKQHKTVCIMQIGKKLSDGTIHDDRAADYDDWELNADILVYYPILDIALEISSMGIRVDETSLVKQLEIKNQSDRLTLPFHQQLLNKQLPYTIGGGIGQSRLCLLLLNKIHIGEVQASIWDEDTLAYAKELGILLL